ncbi:hydroxymethylbilane synthase [Demequina sp. SYSU T00068]|uniref:hydroxymethylbilane synthase n=1 Tax=Demequina lignilytica TaxID=3051663 RepID=UPI0026036F94|nr:hydroxymethylbilane synthase [Demequina sp. SYSU T00068]MDN4489789.1 hydroxymethylbilane synthase [Demequina sp. SYSU T00068]
MNLRLGTRGSALATAQAGQFADAVVAAGAAQGVEVSVELVTVTTKGDVDKGSLVGLSQTGVFVTALREALLADECDFVVHSLKDMPTAPFDGLETVAIPEREDPRDVLCTEGESLEELPHGARVGTGSPRRAAQLLALRPDLEVVPIRGNVDTRLGKVGEELDGVVLAAAGLNRLGRGAEATEPLSVDRMVPAPGQGALAVEIRSDAAPALRDLLGSLDHADTRAAVTAERSALATLEAGCAAPVAAYGTVARGRLTLHTRVIGADGRLALNERNIGVPSEAASLGRSSGYSLLGRGAERLMRSS